MSVNPGLKPPAMLNFLPLPGVSQLRAEVNEELLYPGKTLYHKKEDKSIE